MVMAVFLRTPRLVLRDFTPADVDNLHELDADPAVTKYVNGGRPTPRAANGCADQCLGNGYPRH